MSNTKRKKKTGKRSRRRNVDEKKGSMLSMRAGFKNVVGTGEKKKKPASPGSNFITVMLFVAVVALIIWTLART